MSDDIFGLAEDQPTEFSILGPDGKRMTPQQVAAASARAANAMQELQEGHSERERALREAFENGEISESQYRDGMARIATLREACSANQPGHRGIRGYAQVPTASLMHEGAQHGFRRS